MIGPGFVRTMAAKAAAGLGVRGVLAIVAVLAAAGGWGLWHLERGAHATTRQTLAGRVTEVATLKQERDAARARVEQEREQCATDLAGEIQRGAIEADKARRAGEAIASLTTACVQTQGPEATNRALRELLGEEQ